MAVSLLFGCGGYDATAVSVGQNQGIYSGVGAFNWYGGFHFDPPLGSLGGPNAAKNA